MHELVAEIVASLAAGRRLACCRLVETRGSTPQKAGAMMLVFPDGSQAGTLGGGCVEAEVKRRALAILEDGRATMAQFQLDSDYGWDDGLICGGRMTILVDPLVEPAAAAYYARLNEALAQGQGATEAVVFDGAKCGLPETACWLFDQHDVAVASLRAEAAQNGVPLRSGPSGAVHAPRAVLERFVPIASRPKPSAVGGIAYLPILPRCRLVIVGGGHIGHALGNLAAELDFNVWVVDDREMYVSAERFPKAQRRIIGPIGEVLPKLDVTSDTYCVIVTRGHNHDEEALFHLVDRGARYVGLIGSKRKIKMIFEDLLVSGIAQEKLDRVYAPLGIEIGSQSVMEIAVSIAAELVAHRNRGVVPGKEEKAMAAPGGANH